MNGPEPVKSEICVLGSVSATRLGIMNGTLELGLPSADRTRPVCSLRTMRNVRGSTTAISFTKLMSFCPIESFAPQRLIEAAQSSAVTGVPSCQARPSRRVSVYVSLSALTSYLSSICGRISPFASVAKSVS